MLRKKLKQIVAIAMISILSIAMLSGCGSKDDGKLVVRVWTGSGGTKEFMDKKIEEFNNSHDDIRIEYQTIASNLDDMTKNAFENDNGPEIFDGSASVAQQYRKLGYVVSIEDLEGGKDFVANLGVEVPDDYRYYYEGKLYSYPYAFINGGLIYNKDLFKAAGIVDENGEAKPPVTWDEMVEDCKKIAKLGKGIYATGHPMKDMKWYYNFIWGASASENSIIDFNYEKQEVKFNSKRMLEYVLQMKDEGLLFPGSESLDNDTLRLQFAEGNVGMYFGCSWDVGVLTQQFPAKCEWAVAPYPTYNENGDKYLQSGQAIATMAIGNSALKSPAMSKAVMEVFAYLYSDELAAGKMEQMLEIPYKTTILDQVDDSKFAEQWKQFCEIQEITRVPNPAPSLKVEGDKDLAVYDKVWAGKISIKEAIEDLEKRYTDAFKKGVANGEIDLGMYSNVDFKRR